jgi:phosphocarrier protein HPr
MQTIVSVFVDVTNKKGIHARPASLLARTASQFDAEVLIELGEQVVSGKDVLGILSLEALCGSKIRLMVSGPDAKEAGGELEELIKTGFDFD